MTVIPTFPPSCFPGLPVGAEPIRGNPGTAPAWGRRKGDHAASGRRLFPDGDYPAGRFSPPAPTRSLCASGVPPRIRGRSPPQRPGHLRERSRTLWTLAAGTTRPGASRVQPRPRQRIHPSPDDPVRRSPHAARSCDRGRGAACDGVPRSPGIDGHRNLGDAPARRALGTIEMPAHRRPLGPGPEGAAPAGSTCRVDRGGRRAAPVPVSRNWLRRAGLPARYRARRLPDRGLPDCRGGWLCVPLQPRGPAPGPRPEQRLHTGRLRRAPVHAEQAGRNAGHTDTDPGPAHRT